MSAFITKKQSLIIFLCSYLTALAITLVLHYSLAGPKLGLVYDVLTGFRSPPPVSSEILIIETDEVIEPGDMYAVLMTLSEMGASNLLIEVPVLATGSGRTESGVGFSYRINDEFSLLERNIRNLFEAIRLGLVPPAESPDYVENLVELAARGRDRLNSAIIKQDEAGSVLQAQAEAVFGKAITAEDLRVQSAEDSWTSLYSRPRPDSDGTFRRIAPVIPEKKQRTSNPAILSFFEQGLATGGNRMEHIVYRALKPRWRKSDIELGESGPVLVNRVMSRGEEVQFRFPLDRNGNLLIEKPAKNDDFRRLTVEQFREYERGDKALARLLKEAQTLGVYAETVPERIPLILFEYAESLKEALLSDPDDVKRGEWINARADYIASLDDFLYGPAEMTLVNGYEELIAGEELGEEGITRLQNLRDELIRAFVAMREKHRELIEGRSLLETAIASSFCVMGPAAPADEVSLPESSALLANALLTGSSITPGQHWHSLFWSLAASLAVLVCIHALSPLWLLALGSAASLLCGIAFGAAFVINAYWIDPLMPMAACLGGTLVMALSRFGISYGRSLHFRFAYTAALNTVMLKKLVKAGRPIPGETECVPAAIIAVKKSAAEKNDSPLAAAQAAAEFHKTVSRLFKQEGALVFNCGRETALACFGSPPERICLKETMTHPALKAVLCTSTLLDSPLCADWQFGIDYGECAFTWSAETGCTAYGRPVTRAAILASLGPRFNVQAIIGEQVKTESGIEAKKLALLEGETVYELSPNKTPQ